jgi:hypothetical protein
MNGRRLLMTSPAHPGKARRLANIFEVASDIPIDIFHVELLSQIILQFNARPFS